MRAHMCVRATSLESESPREETWGSKPNFTIRSPYFTTLRTTFIVQNKHSTHTQTVLGIKTSNIFRTTNEDYNARDLSSVPKFTKKKTKNPPNQLTTPWEGSLLEDFRPFGQIVRHRWIASMICQGFDKLC